MPVETLKVKLPTLRDMHESLPGAFTPEDRLVSFLAPESISPASTAGLQAVLFDLDGVLVNTAEFHYQAWQRLADELGIPFSRKHNEAFRGVSRMDCLDKLLGAHARSIADEEKAILAEKKNALYVQLIESLKPADILPGARILALSLGTRAVRMAVVSMSKNARRVLELLGIESWFDLVIDGHSVSKSKPHPEGFLMAAQMLDAHPRQCVVIEDAEAGIRAGRAAGMKTIGIGDPTGPLADLADLTFRGLDELHLDTLVSLPPGHRTTHGTVTAA